MRKHRKTAKNRPEMPLRYLTLGLLLLAAPLTAQAQSNAKTINEHPATQVTFGYLRNAMGQDWKKAAALIEPASLESLKERYINRIKASSTIDEEIAHVRRLDCANLKEVEGLAALDFYVRYHQGVQKRFDVDQAKLNEILATLEVKLMSLAEENVDGSKLTHILVRTRHNNGDRQISALDLVSLILVDSSWKVTLNAQDPLVKQLPPKK